MTMFKTLLSTVALHASVSYASQVFFGDTCIDVHRNGSCGTACVLSPTPLTSMDPRIVRYYTKAGIYKTKGKVYLTYLADDSVVKIINHENAAFRSTRSPEIKRKNVKQLDLISRKTSEMCCTLNVTNKVLCPGSYTLKNFPNKDAYEDSPLQKVIYNEKTYWVFLDSLHEQLTGLKKPMFPEQRCNTTFGSYTFQAHVRIEKAEKKYSTPEDDGSSITCTNTHATPNGLVPGVDYSNIPDKNWDILAHEAEIAEIERQNKLPKHVRSENSDANSDPDTWKIDEPCEARRKGTWYDATIEKVNGDGTYKVRYADRSYNSRHPAGKLRRPTKTNDLIKEDQEDSDTKSYSDNDLIKKSHVSGDDSFEKYWDLAKVQDKSTSP